MNAAFDDLAAESIGRADDLARFHSAARQQGASELRPVIAPGIRVDLGRPSELAPRHYRHVFVQSALVQVLDQRAEGLVEQREMREQFAVIVAVKIPAAKIERDTACPRFDEAAGREKMFAVARRAVAVILRVALAVALAHVRGFLAQVERFHEFARGEDVERLLIERVETFDLAALVEITSKPVETREQTSAIRKPIQRDAVELQIIHARSIGAKGRVCRPKKTGMPRRAVRWMSGLRREANERRDAGPGLAFQLREHCPHRRPAARRLLRHRPAGVADE